MSFFNLTQNNIIEPVQTSPLAHTYSSGPSTGLLIILTPGSTLPPEVRGPTQGRKTWSTEVHKGPASPVQAATVNQRADRHRKQSLATMPELSLSPSPLLQGLPCLCDLKWSHTHSPGPPNQQGHSNSSNVSPHSTLTSALGGGHTGKLRLNKVQSSPRGTANCEPRLGPHVQLLGQAEQRGNRMPAHLPAATS